MRATDLCFRSPKEKTAEFNNPLVTFDGRFLPILHPTKNPTFPRSRRFSQYDIDARRTGSNAGPGSYNLIQEPGAEWRINGTPLYRNLHADKDTSDNGYIFVGNSMLYEPSFTLTRRKTQKNSSSDSFYSKDIVRRSSSIKESDETWRESEGKEMIQDKRIENIGKIKEQSETIRESSRVKTAENRGRRTGKSLNEQFRRSPYVSVKAKNIKIRGKEGQKI